MNATELFLKTVDAYKAWIATGKDFVAHTDLWVAWDAAVCEYAEAMNVSRDHASLHVTEAIRTRSV
mgnify:CR=1 FL=1|jgi:hypothetical protein